MRTAVLTQFLTKESPDMKEFACGAVVPGCVATFRADSEEGILAQVAQHAHDDHGLTEIGDDLVAAVCANIQSV